MGLSNRQQGATTYGGQGMSYWNYRIVSYGNGYYGLHEVYYDAGDEAESMTDDPVGFIGESPEELIKEVKFAIKEAKKKPVLDISWKDWRN